MAGSPAGAPFPPFQQQRTGQTEARAQTLMLERRSLDFGQAGCLLLTPLLAASPSPFRFASPAVEGAGPDDEEVGGEGPSPSPSLVASSDGEGGEDAVRCFPPPPPPASAFLSTSFSRGAPLACGLPRFFLAPMTGLVLSFFFLNLPRGVAGKPQTVVRGGYNFFPEMLAVSLTRSDNRHPHSAEMRSRFKRDFYSAPPRCSVDPARSSETWQFVPNRSSKGQTSDRRRRVITQSD